MVSEKLKTFFGKVKDRLKLKDIAMFTGKEVVGAIPVIGSVIKDAINEFSPDEKEELIKELKELSESQFMEISEKAESSVEYLKDIQKLALYNLEELRVEHEEIKELIRSLIEELKPAVSIPTIQSALKKGDSIKGDFFKKKLEWIDFEEGFIVERREVNELIKKLENNGIQLVLGDPASGKSVILKNIGFNLAKKGHSVYIIELKKWSADRIESYFKEAQKIDDERTVIIVDDAHLQLFKCEGLVRDFEKMRTKLIIGTREVKGLKESPKETSEFQKLAQTKISAIDATEKIICTFLNKKHGIIDEHRIQAVSEDLEEYKHDLWYLSWALETYDKDTDTVSKEEVYSAINECITNIRISEGKTISGGDILLPLSVFYRFEIPIEKRFLTKILEIDKSYIDDLIGISEIHEIKEKGRRTMLSLHHSSLASLYFETYQMTDLFPELGEDIKEKITEQSKYDDWERGLLYLYLKSEPKNLLDVLISLRRNWPLDEEGELITIIGELIENNEIKDSIKKSIEKEKDILKVGKSVGIIAEASEEVALKLVDSVSSRIDKEEESWKIGECACDIAIASEEVALKLVYSVSSITKIGNCVSDIAVSISEEMALKLVDSVSSRIEKEEELWNIEWCVSNIAIASEEVALKLVDSVSSRIDKEEDIEKIGDFVKEFVDTIEYADASEQVLEEILKGINISILLSKIKNEEDIEKVGLCLGSIAGASTYLQDFKVLEEIVEGMNIDILLSKIEKEEDVEKIRSFVEDIAWVSEEVAQKIVRSSPKASILMQ